MMMYLRGIWKVGRWTLAVLGHIILVVRIPPGQVGAQPHHLQPLPLLLLQLSMCYLCAPTSGLKTE